ncbi:hypothetical protein FNO01nite_14040 [Flavobacterium noncentrifugens]|uniref:Uncharacterized protein n=1 Tax=Flavobacterium noncentrifugens TaxID=1128970 RepID=A0A1G8W3H8_9FLAO|nr:hypothetical protein FNO01nite_14040 [Flavobacterium noncentrifugens]SDJ72040.1 hypothetical protein SAMN04487935_1606 [Flavobacterium noncentrifugens]
MKDLDKVPAGNSGFIKSKPTSNEAGFFYIIRKGFQSKTDYLFLTLISTFKSKVAVSLQLLRKPPV